MVASSVLGLVVALDPLSYPRWPLWVLVLPFMAGGEIVQRLARLLLAARRLAPGQHRCLAANPALAAGFAAILLCRTGADLEHTAWLSKFAALLTRRAVNRSLRLREALLCRYSAPVGGMKRPVRQALDPGVARRAGHLQRQLAAPMPCFKGGPPIGEGPGQAGSPAWHPPGSNRDNRKTAALPHCAKACPIAPSATEP